jgi:hypothetical protein
MTHNEETAVMKDCIMRAVALPMIYSDEAVKTLIVQVAALRRQAETQGELKLLMAYEDFLRECAA